MPFFRTRWITHYGTSAVPMDPPHPTYLGAPCKNTSLLDIFAACPNPIDCAQELEEADVDECFQEDEPRETPTNKDDDAWRWCKEVFAEARRRGACEWLANEMKLALKKLKSDFPIDEARAPEARKKCCGL